MLPINKKSKLMNQQSHMKIQNELISFLESSFNFSKPLSNLIIAVHDCSDLPQLMNLFLLDDENKYGHVFVPTNQTQTGGACQACGQNRGMHSHQITWQYLKQYEIEYENFQKSQKKLIQVDLDQQAGFDQLSDHQFFQSFNKPYSAIKGKQQKTCSICCATFFIDQLITINDKVHEVCLTCMNQYLKQQILNLKVDKIVCPHCEIALDKQTIQKYVVPSYYQKYLKFSKNLQIQKNPNFKWCPNPKCSVVITINKKKAVIKCPKCATQVCTKCNRQAHPKQSCDQAIQKAFEGLQNVSQIHRCKKCKALVQKIAGCNHMTCGICRYEWCWLCGSTYSSFHFKPFNPLGCAGMQNSDVSGSTKCKIYLIRFLMFLGIIILFPILLPIAMLASGPFILFNFISRRCFHFYGCCQNFFAGCIIIPIGLAVNPIVWIGIIIYFIPVLYGTIKQYRDNRRNMLQHSQNQIKRNLLENDGQVVFNQQ